MISFTRHSSSPASLRTSPQSAWSSSSVTPFPIFGLLCLRPSTCSATWTVLTWSFSYSVTLGGSTSGLSVSQPSSGSIRVTFYSRNAPSCRRTLTTAIISLAPSAPWTSSGTIWSLRAPGIDWPRGYLSISRMISQRTKSKSDQCTQVTLSLHDIISLFKSSQ